MKTGKTMRGIRSSPRLFSPPSAPSDLLALALLTRIRFLLNSPGLPIGFNNLFKPIVIRS